VGATDADDIKEVIAQTFVAIGTLARALHVEDARLQPTLDAITAQAAAAHPAAQDAGLILLIGGKLIPQATTGKAPQLLDVKQQETGQGPCIEAAREQTLICLNDLQQDPRWPEFSAEAQAWGLAACSARRCGSTNGPWGHSPCTPHSHELSASMTNGSLNCSRRWPRWRSLKPSEPTISGPP
jgi:hypothetical protein